MLSLSLIRTRKDPLSFPGNMRLFSASKRLIFPKYHLKIQKNTQIVQYRVQLIAQVINNGSIIGDHPLFNSHSFESDMFNELFTKLIPHHSYNNNDAENQYS